MNHELNVELQTRAARKFVRMALDRGYVVSVFDGEEYTVRQSNDFKEITEALWSTDEDALIIRKNVSGDRIGRAWLVYGNSAHELIADWTVGNPDFDSLMAEWEAYAEQIEERYYA